MGVPWKKIGKFGLAFGSNLVPGGQIINTAVAELGKPDDPAQGHDFAASGIRQIIQASFPELLDSLDEIAASWTFVAAAEREELEKEARRALRRQAAARRRRRE